MSSCVLTDPDITLYAVHLHDAINKYVLAAYECKSIWSETLWIWEYSIIIMAAYGLLSGVPRS